VSMGTTTDDLEWPFYTLHAISALAELVINVSSITLLKLCLRRAALSIT